MAATLDRKEFEISRKDSLVKREPKGWGYSVALNSFVHSQVPAERFNHVKPSITNSLMLHDKKILIMHLTRFKELCLLSNQYDFGKTQEIFLTVISRLISLHIDEISFSLTYENSCFFIMKKGDYEFHLNYFFDSDPSEFEDEAVLVTYYKDYKLPSSAGVFNEVIENAKGYINPEEPLVYWIY